MIRKAAKAAIEATVLRLDSRMNVFESRTEKKFSSSELPACTVVTTSEGIDNDQIKESVDEKQRSLSLSIIVCTSGSNEEELAEALDALSLVVESAIEDDITLGGAVNGAFYSGFDIDTASDGSAYGGSLMLKYTVIYQFTPDRDLSDVVPLLRANVQYNLEHAQAEADRAKDNITLPGPTP